MIGVMSLVDRRVKELRVLVAPASASTKQQQQRKRVDHQAMLKVNVKVSAQKHDHDFERHAPERWKPVSGLCRVHRSVAATVAVGFSARGHALYAAAEGVNGRTKQEKSMVPRMAVGGLVSESVTSLWI
jgi:hypothetical protein